MTKKNDKLIAARKRGLNDFGWFAREIVFGDMELDDPTSAMCARPSSPHGLFVDFLESTEQGFGKKYQTYTLLMAPRGYYKTSITVVAYCLWFMARNPNKRILLVSGGADLSFESLGQIKWHCESNKRLLQLYPYLQSGSQWSAKKIRIASFRRADAKEASITAIGVGTKITGRHFDLIIFDDVVDEKVETADGHQKIIDYFKLMTPILQSSGKGSQMRVIGTMWDRKDLYNHIIDAQDKAIESGEEHLPYKILKFGVYDDDGESRWYEHLSIEDLDRIRLKMNDSQKWANQYLNEVISTEDQLIMREDYNSYIVADDKMPADWINFPTYCTVDPSTGRSRDYTCIWTWVIAPDRQPYVVDIYWGKIGPEQIFNELYARQTKYDYKTIWFEMQINEEMWLDYMRRRIPKGGRLNIIPVRRSARSKDKKDVRILRLGEFIKAGFFRIHSACPRQHEWEQQLFEWPRVVTDDILDAAAEMVPHVDPPHRNIEEVKETVYPEELLRLFNGGASSPSMPSWVRY